MIEILHDFSHQSPGNYGSIVQIGSCRISIINRSTDLHTCFCNLARCLILYGFGFGYGAERQTA